MLAVAFLLFAWGMWRSQRLTLAGFFAGMALLCGPSLWAGLLVLGLTWLFIQGMGSKPASSEATDQSLISNPPVANYQLPISFYRPAVTSLLLTLLFGGTLFFLSPNGLSAWLSALPEYLRGWTAPSPMSAGRVLLAFFAYEPLGIFLAILSLIRGYRTKSPRILRVSLWLGVALLLAVFYRQTSELVWVILPLLILAAWELSRAFQLFAEERVEVGVVVLALMILLVYFWFGVSKIALDPITSLATNSFPLLGRNIQIPGAPYMVLVGVILVIVLCISFIAFGWSARTAWLGMTWAFVIFLGVYSLGTAWGASGLRAPTGVELWKVDQAPVQPNLLLASVNDVSEFSLGHDQSQPVTIVGIDSPALEWVLRDRTLEMVSTLDPQVAPPIVITTAMSDLGLPSAYRGQDFLWRPTPRWQEIQNPDWIRWLVFRQLPREEETIILWVRDDLFPDARETSQQP
jgi:hypothetical protein